jgi:hypothetical protein
MSLHNSIIITKARSGTIDIEKLKRSFREIRESRTISDFDISVIDEDKES